MIHIYQLVDPRDEKPFYVGQSIDTAMRWQQHIATRNKPLKRNNGFTPTQQRIREICDAGLTPDIDVLESCASFSDSRLQEDKWIRRLTDQGYQLTNKLPVIGNLGEAKQHTIINDKIAEMGYMTTIEAAHFLHLTPNRVRGLVCEGTLHIKKLGGMNLYSQDELIHYNENKTAGGRRKSS
jgi:hypothetical protein